MSIGPHYLYRLPHLHTAHIFAAPAHGRPDHPRCLYDGTYADVQEELRNLVIPWNRYCRGLREVQLHAGYVMRRAYEGDRWQMREVHEVRESCDFVY